MWAEVRVIPRNNRRLTGVGRFRIFSDIVGLAIAPVKNDAFLQLGNYGQVNGGVIAWGISSSIYGKIDTVRVE